MEEIKDKDYSLEAVPESARKGFRSMFFVMLGFTFFSASMSVGAKLGNGLDFSELHKLALLFEKIDEKHTYEKVIFDSYMENNSYNLTQEQLDLAYLEYKKARGL